MRVPGVTFVQGRNDYGPADLVAVAIHCTDNNASAEAEASYATRRTDGVGSHFYVDSNSVVQSIDTSRRTGHAGSRNGNHNSIAVEITGKTHWSREEWLDAVDWAELARVLAVVCDRYNIAVRRASVAEMKRNPRVRAFYGHNDMRLAWGGTTHTDPGPNFPWDHLLDTVELAMNGEGDMALDAADKEWLEDMMRRQSAYGYHDAMHVANTKQNFNGLSYEGKGAVGKSIRQNFAGLVALGAGDVDETAIVAGVLAGLTPSQIAGAVASALPADLARQVTDELAARLQS